MPQPLFSPGDELGHYRLIEEIGGGGQGRVWRARDTRFDRDVAIKILTATVLTDEGARDRFRQEAKAVGQLNHPNIAMAHDFDDKPVDYLVTEYVSGVGLDKKLADGALPQETVLALGIQLASGLEAAHRQGIIHRDLKPGNLRINLDGNLKILDFGLAEMFDPSKDIASLETVALNMTLTGTLPYMAPEQFGGVSDQRTDLWSVGAVLYEMATGKLPFTETQIHALRDAIQHKEPVRPCEIVPSISQGLESVILRCLQKNPNRRYQTAGELREDLARLAEGRRVKPVARLQEKSFAFALLALLLGVSALTVYHFWPEIRDRLWPQPPGATGRFRVLAVLPIETANEDASENALARGVAETVSARIAQGANGHTLQVIPPNELIAQGVRTAEAARREFNADRVLSIALQRSGDKMRVTCSLIDPKTHQQLNARMLTGDANDLFALEDNAVTDVFAMLPTDARSEQPTPSEVLAAAPAAYEYYVRGRGYLLDYQKPENIDAAIKEFEQALKISPTYAPAYAGLGEAYWHGYKADRGKDWLDKAKTNCEKALGADPKLAEAHVCLGNLYNDTGKYKEAVEEFQRALALDHENVDALGGLGLAFERLRNPAAAEETYKKAIAQHPQYWAVYNWLGAFYYSQARYVDAVPMFQKVIALTPDNQRGYNNLGGIFVMEGKYSDAIPPLRKATELAPSRDAYGNLGAAYFYLRQYPQAVDAFQLAITQDAEDAATWGYLADALYWTPGRRNEASRAHRKGVDLARAQLSVNPKDAMNYALLAEFSAMLDQKQTAMDAIHTALILAPDNAEIRFKAALVYNQFGDSERALSWLEKAVAAGYSPIVVRDTPEFYTLREYPAFRSLVARK